jgi:predicted nucleic acid-binding protein
MAGPPYLADSNILLRLVKRDDPEYPLVRGAVDALLDQGIELAYTLQNMTEFWNASTRPRGRNGFGLSIEKTQTNAQEIERSFTYLPDTEAVYRQWRRLVVAHRISGVQVHDARLAATMYAYGMTHILTINTSDFARFGELTAIHPGHPRWAS